MKLSPATFLSVRTRCLPLLERLHDLFREMDRFYETVAAQYGFQCNGCMENCCETRFYHHTLLEYLYLMEGVGRLPADARRDVLEKARTVNRRADDADRRRLTCRSMCPLNQDGRCRLYPHRPMICRLHGLPHELHPSAGRVQRHPGCDAFFEQCRMRGKTDYIPFDRTPFYQRMAALEKELRRETGYEGKIKLTIAQMLATLTEPDHEND